METTAIMVRTPMMMPSNVRNVLNLFDQRELMAIETDSLRFILAIFGYNILHYMIRKDKAKVHGDQVLTTPNRENKISGDVMKDFLLERRVNHVSNK